MKKVMTAGAAAILMTGAFAARAEQTPPDAEATYGDVQLTGLARESWPLNPEGAHFAMVCNANGPDGFLSIRSAPGVHEEEVGRLFPLAIVTVDTREISGDWVRVTDAHRTHGRDGLPLEDVLSLSIKGWAHTGYLCDFLD